MKYMILLVCSALVVYIAKKILRDDPTDEILAERRRQDEIGLR